MKIIVMSDSHGDGQTLDIIQNEIASAYFHCGDSERPYDDPLLQPMYRVKGNCDFDEQFPEMVLEVLDHKRILMVHGHMHDVKMNLLPLFYEAKQQAADIVLFGHSHIYGAELKDGILFVNPGSTLLPRGGHPATYAVIEWEALITVSFYTMEQELVDQIVFDQL